MTANSRLPLIVAVNDWPATDQRAWETACAPPLVFSDGMKRAREWRAKTRKGNVEAYGRWIGFLRDIGELEATSPPHERPSVDRLERYHRHLTDGGMSDFSIAAMVQRLGNMLQAIEPSTDWKWIGRAASRLGARARPRRDMEAKMRPPEEFLQLGLDLMAAADAKAPCHASARSYVDGLLIAFLTVRPLRIGNVAAMRIGRHITGRAPEWRIVFSADEMKNHHPLLASWPAHLSANLERYLAIYRPHLLEDAIPADIDLLWPSAKGREMNANSLSDQIGRRTLAKFGTKIRAHAFRHVAATTISETEPENISEAAAVLGHAHIDTTQKHYNRARGLAAHRAYHQTVLVHRSKPRRCSDDPDLGKP